MTTMSTLVATGARHGLWYVAEVNEGVTPATPAFKPVPHTATTLGMSKETFESNNLRSDRQVSQFSHGNKQVGGDASAELLYGAFDDLIEAVLCGTWTANVLKAGVLRRSFTVERNFEDIGVYLRYSGTHVSSWNFNVSTSGIITTSFTFVGRDQADAATPITGATYAAQPVTSPFTSAKAVIEEGGAPLALATSFDFTIDNGIEALFVIGSDESITPSIKKSRVTCNATMLFTSTAMLNKFVNETASSFVITLEDAQGNALEVKMSNIKYNSGQPDVNGDGPISLQMSFVALFDGTDGSQVVLTRTPTP